MATRPQFTAKMRYVRNVLTSFFASLSALIFSRIMLNAYYSAYEYNEIDFKAYEAKAFLVIVAIYRSLRETEDNSEANSFHPFHLIAVS